MKFLHFADCHLDGFRDRKLAALGYHNFRKVIETALDENVDFVLLAGDLFNTAIPRVEALKVATEELRKLQQANIPVYAIAGSHDYSPHGNSVLDVLELAGLLTTVMKGEVVEGRLQLRFTKDPKTGALLTGIIGKKGMLDSVYYKDLDTSKLTGKGFRIFLFHTALEELKTKEVEHMPGHSISMLPTGFDYYAGGHVHIVKRYSGDNYQHIVYPGPTFPNSFSELEHLGKGSFVMYDDSKDPAYEHRFLEPKKVVAVHVDVDGLSAQEAHERLLEQEVAADTIMLLRITGTLSEGTIKDIGLDDIIRTYHRDGAFHVLRNTAKLSSMSFTEVEVSSGTDVKEIEREAIEEHVGQIKLPEDLDERQLIATLLDRLELEQHDGETKTAFKERVVEEAKAVLEK